MLASPSLRFGEGNIRVSGRERKRMRNGVWDMEEFKKEVMIEDEGVETLKNFRRPQNLRKSRKGGREKKSRME